MVAAFADSRAGAPFRSVGELRIPVLAPALGGEIEEVPERPDRVHMARILALGRLREEQFRVVEVVNLVATANEDVQRGDLAPVLRFAMVVAVVGGAGGRDEPQPRPAARARVLADPAAGR